MSSSTQSLSKIVQNTGTNPEMKKLVTSSTLTDKNDAVTHKANSRNKRKIMKHSGTNPQITPTKSSSTNTKNTATTATATSTAGSNNNNNNTDKGTVNYREKLKSYDNNFRISVTKKVGKSEWKVNI